MSVVSAGTRAAEPALGLVTRIPGAKLLLVDDETALREALRVFFTNRGLHVSAFDNPLAALAAAEQQTFDVGLFDVRMPDMSGLDLLEKVKRIQPGIEVVMITGHGTVEDAFRAVSLGAFNFLKKPFDELKEVALVVERAFERKQLRDRNRFLEDRVQSAERFDELIGRSAAMRQVFDQISLAAPTDVTVLIHGETGTGKELVARAIHKLSRRASGPMLSVNCGAIPVSLQEAELFGYEKGAFTGAITSRKGYFEAADGGSIFLDEIADAQPSTQVAFLRVLSNGEIVRVGTHAMRKVNVRVIAASHKDLKAQVTAGQFREDLYFRLDVMKIRLPPLRERQEDIPVLIDHFVRKYAQRMEKPVRGVTSEALEILVRHPWPGNVRELESVVESGVVMCRGEQIEALDLRPDFRDAVARLRPAPAVETSDAVFDLPFSKAKELAVAEFEKRYVGRLLERAEGNISEAARQASLDRANFKRILGRYPEVFGRERD